MNRFEQLSDGDLRRALHNGRIGVGEWREKATRQEMITALTIREREMAGAYEMVGHPAADEIARRIRSDIE